MAKKKTQKKKSIGEKIHDAVLGETPTENEIDSPEVDDTDANEETSEVLDQEQVSEVLDQAEVEDASDVKTPEAISEEKPDAIKKVRGKDLKFKT